MKENQKKLIKSVKKKTEELDAAKADLDKAKSDLDEANYKISNLEEKKNSISFELKKKSNALIEARIRIGDLENEVSVGAKAIQELESKLKLMQVELRGYQIGIIGKDKTMSLSRNWIKMRSRIRMWQNQRSLMLFLRRM